MTATPVRPTGRGPRVPRPERRPALLDPAGLRCLRHDPVAAAAAPGPRPSGRVAGGSVAGGSTAGGSGAGGGPAVTTAGGPDPQLDSWLVDKARDGDVAAYEALVRRHRDRIYRIALRMVGDRADAEDIAQEVVIQLWTGLAAYAGTSAFTTWLYRVVVNRCLDHRRRKATSPTAPVPAAEESGHPVVPSADRQATDRMRLAATMRAIADLPEEQRSVIVLYQMEGLSYREVAAVLRVSESSVRGRLARARAALAHRLRDWT